MIARLAYRSRQLWNALFSPRMPVSDEALLSQLTTPQYSLFRSMQPSEQAHAYQMFERLKADGHSEPDLLTAALLHDAGKTRQPLSIIDRIVIVLGKRLFREKARGWAVGPMDGLRRPFVVADRHAGWGADLAAQAGATPVSVELIRRHQEARLSTPGSTFERLLAALQAADDES
jgi:hypothetical protein